MDGSGIDIINQYDLNIIQNGDFASDRIGKTKSAIEFSYGYAYVPPGVYIDPATGGFTMMLWVRFKSLENWMRVIDFGTDLNTVNSDGFFITINHGKLSFLINNKQKSILFRENDIYTVNIDWFHFAISVSNTLKTVGYFINGKNVKNSVMPGKFEFIKFIIILGKIIVFVFYEENAYRAVNRTYTGIGKSLFGWDPLFNGYVDDLKIFNKALSEKEISMNFYNL